MAERDAGADRSIVCTDRIELREEQARIGKRRVEGCVAVITRRPITIRTTVEIDVTHEELEITYEPGDGSELAGELDPRPIIIQLRTEEIEIVRHLRVVEEVVVSKRLVVEAGAVQVALRHEELAVEIGSD